MNNRCINQDVGRLLHAYELGILEEPELAGFEQHLMICPACFSSLKAWEQRVALFKSDPDLLQIATSMSPQPPAGRNAWLARLWPRDRTLFLRPGFSYLLAAVAALYIVYFTITEPTPFPSESQVLYLSSVRASEIVHFTLSDGEPLVVSFALGSYHSDQRVSLALLHNGETVYTAARLEHIDELGTGAIVLGPEVLESGTYRLELVTSRPGELSHPDTLQYQFRLSLRDE